jgi:citrate lyase gamma subunit
MKKWLIGVMLVCMVVFAGCGGARVKMPNPPNDPNYLFATTTATSRDMQLAIEKAKQDARVDISSQIESRVMALIKKFDEEVGRTEDSEILQQFTKVSKTVIDQTLVGCRVRKQEIIKEGELYRAYVLMELPLATAKEALLNQIKEREHLYTRFRASQSFKELEKEVKALREFKKEQEKGMMGGE